MSPRLPAALGLALLAASPHRGGAGQKREPPVFGSNVSIVSIPVFVADRHGRAMRGLGPEDFEVYDDGKRMPVVSFQYFDTTSDEDQEEIRAAPAARRHFLFLFDLSFTTPGGLTKARQSARDFIRTKLARSDLVSVATVDVHHGVRLVANFTEDRVLIARAMETLGVTTAGRFGDPLALAASVELLNADIQQAGRTSGGETDAQQQSILAVLARRFRAAEEHFYRGQVSALIGSIEELGKALHAVDGRKQILFFSAGFDSRALVGLSGSDLRNVSEAVVEGRLAEVDPLTRGGDTRLRDFFSRMTRTLANADCVVHTLDVTGLGSGEDRLTQLDITRDTTPVQGGVESLNFMASETGGRLFRGANDLRGALSEISEMTSRYYILGYQPEDLAGPGRYHRLKVKVRRQGARVSHRAGYSERPPRAALTPLQRKFEAAQLVMTGVGQNDLKFSALCLPFPAPGQAQTLGIVLQVPKEQIRWEPGRSTSLEVYGYAVAADGTVSDNLAQLIRLDPGQADATRQARGLAFLGSFRVPPGQYTIRLMVQEPDTGAAGVQFLDVTVPPYDARSGFLLPPVIMDDASRWLGQVMNGSTAAPLPFIVGQQPFLPRADFQVRSGVAERLVLIAYDPAGPADPAAGIDIQFSVTNAAGAQVPGGPLRIMKVLREAGGRRTYVLGYTPQGLSPGDYTMRIGIGEGGARLESYALLRVRPGEGAP